MTSIALAVATLGMMRKRLPIEPVVFDPEAGLTLTGTHPEGALDGAFTDINQDQVFAGTVRLPSTPSGTIMEHGGSGTGLFFGSRGSNLRLRSGDGNTVSQTASNNLTAILDVPFSELPMDDELHRLVWDVRVNPGRVRLWIDGVFIGEASTSGGEPLESNRWSGGGSGGWLDGTNSNVGGEIGSGWANRTGSGDLSVYGNQLVDA